MKIANRARSIQFGLSGIVGGSGKAEQIRFLRGRMVRVIPG
jgi:hypothetical protein